VIDPQLGRLVGFQFFKEPSTHVEYLIDDLLGNLGLGLSVIRRHVFRLALGHQVAESNVPLVIVWAAASTKQDVVRMHVQDVLSGGRILKIHFYNVIVCV